MTEPSWAGDIVQQVCLENKRSIPTIVWRQSRTKLNTTGRTSLLRSRIVITLGTRGHDHLQVLLHELAHYLDKSGGALKRLLFIPETIVTQVRLLNGRI
jgi:hypothetical protein